MEPTNNTEKFISYIQEDLKDDNLVKIIDYLVKKKLIAPKNLRNYLIKKDFESILICKKGNVRDAIIELTANYDLEFSTIEYILYKC